MTRPTDSDWTNGPAKWAAVLVLGAASVGGMAWSITMRRPMGARPAIVAPMPTEPTTEPGRVIMREDAPERVSSSGSGARSAPGTPAPTGRLNVNTATAAELELLPGIGPALAGRIVDDREANGPFKSVDDLDRVKGIGPKTLERIHALCSVE